ncbi:MAG: nuclear transport factor 2 family protein [Hyphomonadaceae bacterium]|nr:nuclear transport factor 2 family protein [Hyphomonadaceae bacterium]
MKMKLSFSIAALAVIAACDNVAEPTAPAATETAAAGAVSPEAPAPVGLYRDAATTATAAEAANIARAAALAPADGVTQVVASGDAVFVKSFDGTKATASVYKFAADGQVAEQWTITEAQAASPGAPMATAADDAAESVNQNAVINFVGKAINEQKVAEAVAAVVDPTVKYHGAKTADGVAAYTAVLAAKPAKSAYDVKVIIPQNDLVAVVSLMISGADPATQKRAVMADVFRLSGGKIVEHWEIVQPEG